MEMLEPVAGWAEGSRAEGVEELAVCAGGEAAEDCSCVGSFPCPRQALAIQRLSPSCAPV